MIERFVRAVGTSQAASMTIALDFHRARVNEHKRLHPIRLRAPYALIRRTGRIRRADEQVGRFGAQFAKDFFGARSRNLPFVAGG